MTFLILIAALAGLVWGALFILRGSLLGGCLAFLLIAVCFGHSFLQFDLGNLPLTLDRVVLVVLISAYAVQRWLGRTDPKPLGYADWAFLAFAGLLVVSTFSSSWRVTLPGAISPVWRLIFGYLMPFTLYWIARQSPLTSQRIKLVMGCLAGFGVYLSITGLAEVFQQWWLVFPQYIANPKIGIHFGRARGPMVQAACFGTCLAICLLAAWTWRERLGRWGQLLVFLLSPLYASALYFTYTRSAWLEAAVGLMIVLALTLRGVWRTSVLGAALAGGVLLGAAQWENIMSFKREQSSTETRKSAQMRASFAYVSWAMFQDRPLFGCGFGQYRSEVLPYLADRSTELDLESIRGYVHHNTLLCILVETGAAGLLLLLCLTSMGCGDGAPTTFPVKGKVVYQGSGEPVPSGNVMFLTVGEPRVQASGEINADGTFELYSDLGKPGTVPGEHRVAVEVPRPEPGQLPLVKPQYGSYDTSGITKTVAASNDNFITIEVQRSKK